MDTRFVRRTPSAGGVLAASAALLLLLPAAPGGDTLEAQLPEHRDFHTGMNFGVGYAGVIPDASLGLGVWKNFPSRRFGLFADAKVSNGTIEDDASYCPPTTRPPNLEACTMENVEFQWPVDFPVRDLSEFLIFNAGGFYSITDELAVMAGAGWVRRQDYREYSEMVPDDEDWRVSDTGKYYAPAGEEPVWGAQGVVGLLFRAGNRFVLRFGYETEPGGVSLGLYTSF